MAATTARITLVLLLGCGSLYIAADSIKEAVTDKPDTTSPAVEEPATSAQVEPTVVQQQPSSIPATEVVLATEQQDTAITAVMYP